MDINDNYFTSTSLGSVKECDTTWHVVQQFILHDVVLTHVINNEK